jgi:septal ring factor EnvC (AmiA/AmiB activator)
MRFKTGILFFLFFFSLSFAQVGGDINQKLTANRHSLNEINAQIERIRKKLASQKKTELSLLQQLNLLNKEMALIQHSKGLLEQEIRLLNTKYQQAQQQLKEAEEQLQSLQKLYAQRAVYAYKYGRLRKLEMLLTSRSINQAFVRLKYLKQIARHDENLMELIKKKKKQIAAIEHELQQTLAQKNKSLEELKTKAKTYLAKKREKQRLLKSIKWTRQTYLAELKQKEKERERLLALIASLEKEKKNVNYPKQLARKPANFRFLNMRKAKGKLPWPVKGKVITHYGRIYDPKSKTSIPNSEIEILVKVGTPVKCVFPGVVRAIVYFPSYGNTVVVDHGKGYYTIYSHLGEIFVAKDTYVNKNDVIGKVGDSGYQGKTSLRFGIFGVNKMTNPERWLE